MRCLWTWLYTWYALQIPLLGAEKFWNGLHLKILSMLLLWGLQGWKVHVLQCKELSFMFNKRAHPMRHLRNRLHIRRANKNIMQSGSKLNDQMRGKRMPLLPLPDEHQWRVPGLRSPSMPTVLDIEQFRMRCLWERVRPGPIHAKQVRSGCQHGGKLYHQFLYLWPTSGQCPRHLSRLWSIELWTLCHRKWSRVRYLCGWLRSGCSYQNEVSEIGPFYFKLFSKFLLMRPLPVQIKRSMLELSDSQLPTLFLGKSLWVRRLSKGLPLRCAFENGLRQGRRSGGKLQNADRHLLLRAKSNKIQWPVPHLRCRPLPAVLSLRQQRMRHLSTNVQLQSLNKKVRCSFLPPREQHLANRPLRMR